jgi:hypothetical protein
MYVALAPTFVVMRATEIVELFSALAVRETAYFPSLAAIPLLSVLSAEGYELNC